ncbi:hypothetical protein CDO87_14300 [Sagittula sp. P11]|uniref:helix-turn-helix domain-containing protein n=1 Tax=Sagittula sp. P11 TaxID=2009329 RepID=UPI000C2CE70D|nr:helix-turn-helix transcriptional regulator [Sagittula sp. P11]AUC54276.1 hypothetical protein CDO87_14300 [Sagittula sp. P11]
MTGKIDWERRRVNLRILMAAQGTNATKVARAAGLSPNTLSQFTSGRTSYLSEKTLSKVLPLLGLSATEDLDTDNPLRDPRVAIRRFLDVIPDADLEELRLVLERKYPDLLKR